MKDKVICIGNSNHEKAYIVGNATNEIIPNGLIAKAEVKTEDKEKQIEAISKVMQKCYEKNGLLNFKWFAESAYKYLTEDSVVISREDKAKLVHIATLKNIKSISQLKELLSNITAINDLMGYNDRELEIRQEERKETAEKLIKFVSEHCDNETLIWQLDEFVAKLLGVEIKE